MAANAPFKPSRSRPSLLVRLRRRIFRAVPLLVWSGAIIGIFCLAEIRRAPLPYPAMTEITRYTVTAPAPAKLVTLVVKEEELVEPNQVMGSLDSADLRLRVDRARAEVSRLQSEMAREAALLQVGGEERRTAREMDLRRFRRDVENTRLDALDKWAEIQKDKIELVALADTLRRTTILAKEDYDSQAMLIDARAAHDSLAEQIKDNDVILTELQTRVASADKRLADYLALSPADPAQLVDATAPLSWAVKAQQVELEEIALLRTRLSLRAPARGRVEKILVHQGELLVAGQPLLTIVDTAPRAIVAYIPERDISLVKPGMRAQVTSLGHPEVIAETRVTSLGMTVEQVPPQLWVDPRRPQWGRLVYLELPASWKQLPGAGVRVRLLPE